MALSKAINECMLGCEAYLARVRSDNIPSQKLYQKLGFSKSLESDSFILYRKNSYTD